MHLLRWLHLIARATRSNLPLRLVWGTSVFYLCGGGYYASEMMVSLMTAAACPEEHR